MNQMTSTSRRGRIAALTLLTALAPLVWGTTYAVTSEMLPAGHPLFAGTLRALPAGLVAVAIGTALPRGAWWWRSATLGILNIGLFFPMLFVAAERLPGGVAGTLGAISPLIVAVVGVPLLGERMSAWRIGWGIAGVVGVGLVVLGPTARLDFVGIAAGLTGASSMAIGVTLMKRWGRPQGVSSVSLVGWQLTAGGLFLVPVTLIVEGAPPAIDGRAAIGYGWLGLAGGLVAYIIFFSGVAKLPLASVAPLSLLSPMTAATVGVVVLGESLSTPQIAGLAIALASVLAGQVPPPARSRSIGTATAPPLGSISPQPCPTPLGR
ncbi:MAG: EamA family transporter [Acidimicrobiaceae bacterium]|nr:EamA family transporter [Acidimicrobiaceae bacterium]